MTQGLTTLLAIALVAALAPFIVGLFPRLHIPQVVLLLAGGILIGPEVLDVGARTDVTLIANVGLGFLFLLAGYEVDITLFRQRAGRLALTGWLVSLALATAVTGLLAALGLVNAFIPVALGLTTTALGTLLPILREERMLDGPFRKHVLAAGAAGEFLPVVAIAVFLSTQGSLGGMASLVIVALISLALVKALTAFRSPRLSRIVADGQHGTSQITLRLTVVLLLGLLFLAADFGLDVVLGAFLAGMVLKRWAPGDMEALESKLDHIGYGFFIPVFFVWSGMGIDIVSISENPGRLILFFSLMLVVRGMPTLLIYRKELGGRRRLELSFIVATALPLLVALTEIGLASGEMLPENAAALVGAGALTVLVFPLVATRLHRRDDAEEDSLTSPAA